MKLKMNEIEDALVVEEKKLRSVPISIKEFLLRLFSTINVPQNFDNKLTLNKFEKEVKLYLEK